MGRDGRPSDARKEVQDLGAGGVKRTCPDLSTSYDLDRDSNDILTIDSNDILTIDFVKSELPPVDRGDVESLSGE